MATSIYHNLRTDQQYRAATGLSRAEFDALFPAFALHFTPKSPLPYASKSPVLFTDKREAFFFILFYYKAYPTLQNLGLCFGISNFAASHYLDLLKPCLKAALQQHQAPISRLFKDQAEFEKQFAGVTDLFLDVTEVPIERAKDYVVQKQNFSGKKNSIP